ncbi:MAG: methyltransferase [Ruminococcaceae bacterium]|nr:methyltransferase [Oscillospiraceae bacterium]
MTSRELVKATLEFRNVKDRAPRQLWTLPWAEIYDKENYDNLIKRYHWDIGYPETVYHESSSVESGNSTEIGEYTDAWGCVFENVHRGIIGQVKKPLIPAEDEGWEDTSRVVFPEHWLSFDVEQVNQSCAKSECFLLSGATPRPFEQLQFIRGTENLYIDLMLQPNGFIDFMDKMHEFYCRLLTKWAQTDVDALSFMDDWGAQQSLLINPAIWRDIFKPMYRDYINIAHRHGKKIFMHSDGYTLDIIPDLIELGLDAFNTQIFCMKPEKLAPFKGKITFWGEICRQQLLPHGTKEDIVRAVTSVYQNLWENGGCIAQCEYGPGAKVENVDTVYQTWDRLTGNRF